MRYFIFVKNKTTNKTKDDHRKEKEKERREKGKEGKKKGNIKEDQTKQ